jgi:hypothetical protein
VLKKIYQISLGGRSYLNNDFDIYIPASNYSRTRSPTDFDIDVISRSGGISRTSRIEFAGANSRERTMSSRHFRRRSAAVRTGYGWLPCGRLRTQKEGSRRCYCVNVSTSRRRGVSRPRAARDYGARKSTVALSKLLPIIVLRVD